MSNPEKTAGRFAAIRCMTAVASIVLLLVGWGGQDNADGQQTDTLGSGPSQDITRPISSENLDFVTGQRLYVPAYSEIFSGDETSTYDLTVMLSIRNTDPDTPIVIGSIQYYDTTGALVKEYVETPLELAPMATTEVVISRLDKQGGTGANFIVEWGAEEQVYEPIVEALMISTSAQQGISFLSPARILQDKR